MELRDETTMGEGDIYQECTENAFLLMEGTEEDEAAVSSALNYRKNGL